MVNSYTRIPYNFVKITNTKFIIRSGIIRKDTFARALTYLKILKALRVNNLPIRVKIENFNYKLLSSYFRNIVEMSIITPMEKFRNYSISKVLHIQILP